MNNDGVIKVFSTFLAPVIESNISVVMLMTEQRTLVCPLIGMVPINTLLK